jgi:hypothetical protein
MPRRFVSSYTNKTVSGRIRRPDWIYERGKESKSSTYFEGRRRGFTTPGINVAIGAGRSISCFRPLLPPPPPLTGGAELELAPVAFIGAFIGLHKKKRI